MEISLKCDFALLIFAMAWRNQFKMSSVFALDCLLRLSDRTQPLLKPSLPWPVPILAWEPIAVVRAPVYFALKKNKLPIAHKHLLLSHMRMARNVPARL
jgi:hypothetical protein